MPTYPSGPINIEQGNGAGFVVEFFNASGAAFSPTSATMSISYTNVFSSPQTDNITLSAVNGFMTGTWASSSAGLGLATYTAVSSTPNISVAGQLRIVQRMGSS